MATVAEEDIGRVVRVSGPAVDYFAIRITSEDFDVSEPLNMNRARQAAAQY